MTHDELLASIIDYGENGPIDYGQIDLSKALRAVVELHKENPDNVLTQLYGDKEFYTEKHNACQTCRTVAFPCPTYTEVAEAIRSVM